MNRTLLAILSPIFLAACLSANPTSPPTRFPDVLTTSWDDLSIFKDGLVDSAQLVLSDLNRSSIYHLELTIADDLNHLAGVEDVRYTNREGTSLKEVDFRLFPNILGGTMVIATVLVDGKSSVVTYQLNESLLIVPLEKPLIPGTNTLIHIDFKVTIPITIDLNYGVQAYYDDVLTLAHIYPMIAVYDDKSWNAEIPPQAGDLTYADISFFIVRVKAPRQLILVSSGREVSRRVEGDRQIVTYAAGPARDFYLAASSHFEVFSRQSGQVTLRFYTRRSLKDGAESALETAQRAIKDFSDRFARYPYTELDFVSTPTSALGIEYPGMIAISERIVNPDNAYLEATVAHEVGHQWFYNLVGNDQLDYPWLDESLAQFLTLEYFSDEYGATGGEVFRQELERRWDSVNQADIPVGLPVAEYSGLEYSAIVYGRGALFFEAMRKEMGTQTFDAFLKDYTETYTWDIATPKGMQETAEKHCGCDLTPLFKEWIY
jgi:hypothetical protein